MPPENLETAARRVARKTGGFDYSIGAAINQRPELGLLAMNLIAFWSYTEHKLTGMLANFLKLDFVVAFEMLHAINSPKARTDVIKAVARGKLSDVNFALFSAVLQRSTSTLIRRNQFAHWIWAESSCFPDALLLLNPQGIQESQARHLELSTVQGTPGSSHGGFFRDLQRGYVFTKKDLQDALTDAHQVDNLIGQLSILLQDPSHEEADSRRQQILRDHQVAQMFRKLSKQMPQQAQPE